MKLKLILSVLALMCVFVCCAGAEVYINEVMASNGTVTNGRSDDWLELYNDGSEDVSLSGWYLSDKAYDAKLYAFPSGAHIEAGGYLVVFCAGEKVSDGQKGALYAPFSISAGGETLYLTDPEGNTETVELGAQYGNVSSGPDGSGQWRYFENATPGRQNDEKGYEARAQEPVIETAAGFYDGSVSVTVSCAEGQKIRYTTDCSTPTRSSTAYTGPIRVSKTTVIRAIAVGDGLLSSTAAASTFIINDAPPSDVAVVSIYSDDKYFFDSKTGFLVKGSGKTPNYDQPWEYPAQIEYFDESGQRQLSQSVTCKVAGHSARGYKQKSLSVYARKAFGSSVFACRFFDDRDYDEYAAILLRMTSSDNHSCRMRDAVLAEISEGTGLYYAAGKPIILYINGEYYGHYNLREKANKDSLAQWEGITDEDVIKGCSILESNGMDDFYTVHGENAEWVELVNFCRTHTLDSAENLNYVLSRVDVESLFKYAIFGMLINNYDADNVRMYKFPGGKWKFMLHDIEAGGMNQDVEQTVNQIIKPKEAEIGVYPHPVLAAFLELPGYRELFLQMTAQMIESNFLYTRDVQPVYEKWISALEPLMPRQIKAFPYTGFTMGEWRSNCRASMSRMRSYPQKVIDALCVKLNVTEEERERYFGEAMALLLQYN